jgi:hypothetical protein
MSVRQRFADELEGGIAHSITCDPQRILERKEFEDEGAFWIFDGGDGRYLALCGQDYYETPRFPSSHFELVLGNRHQTVLGVRSHGRRVSASAELSGQDIAWETFPKRDVTLFHAPVDAEVPAVLRALQTTNLAPS